MLLENTDVFLTLKSCLTSCLVFSHAIYEFEMMYFILESALFLYITG